MNAPLARPPVGNVVRARSETEAAWMLAEGREGTRVIAGGSDLMLHIDRGRAAPTSLVDIRRAGMDRLMFTDAALHIGATATATALSRWARLEEHAAGVWEAASTLSVPQIRNVATLGGNLANASPAADMVPPVLAMGGLLEIRRGDQVRRLSADELATGPGRTQLLRDELITNVIVPRWRPGAFHWFTKLGFRDAQIIALTSLAFSCELEGGVVRRVGIALGSVAPRVVRARGVEELLVGQRLTRAIGEEACRLLSEDITPIDDVRSTAAFRIEVARNYLADALARAYVHAQGNTAPRDAQREDVLRYLRDPAPRPPSKASERTDALAAAGTGPAAPVKVMATSELSRRPATTTKANAKKASAKKPAKKASAEKKTAKKASVKKAPAKKATAKKAPAKKASAKKKPAKKASVKKKTAKKPAKKASKKKPARKKP